MLSGLGLTVVNIKHSLQPLLISLTRYHMESKCCDLRNVRALLFHIRKKWYHIGIELHLDVAELDIIKDKYDDPADCLCEMIKLWQKSIYPQPTWSTLSVALRAKAVNEVLLAQQGRFKNYCISQIN